MAKNVKNINKEVSEEKVENEVVIHNIEERREHNKKLDEIERRNDEKNEVVRPYIKYDEKKGTKYIVDSLFLDYLRTYYPSVVIEGHMWFYRNGVFISEKFKETEYLVNEEAFDILTWSKIEDIAKRWKGTSGIRVDPDDINPYDDRYINFKNGMLDMETGELLEHSPKYLSTIQWDANFDPANFDKIYDSEFYKFLDYIQPQEEWKNILRMTIGFSMTTTNVGRRKFFFYDGEPGTGKSTIQNITIGSILPPHARSSVQLNDLSNKNYVAELHGKSVNAVGDLDEGAIKDLGMIKNLAGNDTITADRKYGAPFTFKNRATFTFGTNGMPQVVSRDKSSAFFERIIIIPFKKVIEEEKQDPMAEERISKNERDIIAAWVVSGLVELRKNNWMFPMDGHVQKIIQEYKEENNPLFSFFDEEIQITKSEGDVVPTSKLLENYKEYLNKNGYEDKMTIQTLKKRLSQTFPKTGFKTERRYFNGKQQSCFIGLRFLDENEDTKTKWGNTHGNM